MLYPVPVSHDHVGPSTGARILEFFTRWAPVMQFVGPLVALMTAAIALRSSQAARRAAEATERTLEASNDERARHLRPDVKVELGTLEASEGVFKLHLRAVNVDEENLAHRVKLEASASRNERYREVAQASIVGPGQKVSGKPIIKKQGMPQSEFPVMHCEFVSKVLRGRVTYSDEFGLARWSRLFEVQEHAEGTSDAVKYVYSVQGLTAPRRLLPIERLDEDEPSR